MSLLQLLWDSASRTSCWRWRPDSCRVASLKARSLGSVPALLARKNKEPSDGLRGSCLVVSHFFKALESYLPQQLQHLALGEDLGKDQKMRQDHRHASPLEECVEGGECGISADSNCYMHVCCFVVLQTKQIFPTSFFLRAPVMVTKLSSWLSSSSSEAVAFFSILPSS